MTDKDGINETEMLIKISTDVASIKTKVENIDNSNKEVKAKLKDLDHRMGVVEDTAKEHDSHFRFLNWSLSALCVFLFIGVLAPLLVDWLAKIGGVG